MKLREMIIDQIFRYEANTGKKPKYLILSRNMKIDLTTECLHALDPHADVTRGELREFFGLTLVDPGMVFGGNFKWALGD